MTASDKYPPIMILGCGRSGTSIFGELFDGLAGYRYSSEPPFSQIMDSFGWHQAVKVPTETTGFPADPGLSFPLKDLRRAHPDTLFFWIVRHPLDAICSLRIGIGNGWRHHPRPPDWQAWQARELVEQCAHHWAYINRHGFDAVRGLARLVYFEDMIRAPDIFAANICNHIGIDPSSVSHALEVWSRRVQNTNNSQFVEAQTSRHHSRNDHAVRVERWRENLSKTDVMLARDIVSPLDRQFGYYPEDI